MNVSAHRVVNAALNRLEPTAAGRVWRQLSELDIFNSSLQFAAAFTLGFIPFLMLLSAALGPGLTRAILTRSGFSSQATHDLAMLFTHARPGPAALTVLALVLAVLGGDAIARMLQIWYAKTFRTHMYGWKAMGRRAQWLAGVFGFLALQAVIGRRIQPSGGDIAAASAQFLLSLVFWWWSVHALLSGQIPWRRLFPAGLATATCYTCLGAYISYVMSSSLVASAARYGPIGTVITLLTAEIGLAVALQLGAAIGATVGRGKNGHRHGRPRIPAGPRTDSVSLAATHREDSALVKHLGKLAAEKARWLGGSLSFGILREKPVRIIAVEASEHGAQDGSRGVLRQAALADQRKPVVSLPHLGVQPSFAESAEVVDRCVHGRGVQRIVQLVMPCRRGDQFAREVRDGGRRTGRRLQRLVSAAVCGFAWSSGALCCLTCGKDCSRVTAGDRKPLG